MKPNNRITYRFDVPANRPAKDKLEKSVVGDVRELETTPINGNPGQATFAKNNVVPLYPHSASNGIVGDQPWHNAYQEDVGALEQLIREAESATGQTDTDDAQEELAREKRTFGHAAGSEEQWVPIRAEAMLPSPVAVVTPNSDRLPAESGRMESERRMVPAFETDIAEGNGSYRSHHADDVWDGGAETRATSRRPGGNGPSWLHVFLSVGGALATGAIFGYLILSLFTGSSIWPGADKPANVEDLPVIQPETREPLGLDDLAGATKDDGDDTGGAIVPGAAVNVSNVTETYTLLQYGVFSNADGRDAAIKQLRDGGLAAASMKTAEGYRVYAGIALDGTKAGVIGSNLPDIALYKKEIALQAPERLPFSGGEEAALAFFSSTNDLIAAWSDLVVAQLEQPSLSPLGSIAAEGWRAKHEQWTVRSAAMEEGLSDPGGAAHFAKLKKAIDLAAAAMTEYDNNPSKSHLWSAESRLMEAVLTQKEWFESSSAL